MPVLIEQIELYKGKIDTKSLSKPNIQSNFQSLEYSCDIWCDAIFCSNSYTNCPWIDVNVAPFARKCIHVYI